MQPAPGIYVEWVDDEAVALDMETNRLHYLNPPAALVYALILEHGYEEGLKQLRPVVEAGGVDDGELPDLLESMAQVGLLIEE